MIKSPSLCIVALCFVTITSQAQQDIPALNAVQILQELEKLEETQKSTLRNAKNSAISTLRPGLTSGPTASNIYEKAIEATRFEGRKDKVPAFIEWKKKNADVLRSSDLQNNLRLHIRYILLSMERGDADSPDAFAKPSWEYANALVQQLEQNDKQDNFPNEAKELMDKPINESVISQWLSLGPWFPKGDSWEMSPGNLSGILGKNVRPVWRAEKNPALLESWQLEMQFEADRVTRGRLVHNADNFNSVKQPQMLFARANDMVVLGMSNRAAQEILGLIRAHPNHPDFPNWLARLRELLAPATPA